MRSSFNYVYETVKENSGDEPANEVVVYVVGMSSLLTYGVPSESWLTSPKIQVMSQSILAINSLLKGPDIPGIDPDQVSVTHFSILSQKFFLISLFRKTYYPPPSVILYPNIQMEQSQYHAGTLFPRI